MFPPGYGSGACQFGFFPPGTMARSAKARRSRNAQKQLNFIDNFSVTARAHQLKFGADYRHLNPASDTDNYRFSIGANSYASLQAGIVDSVYNIGGAAITAAIDNYSFFAQDIWKTSPRLTLTYGLRWEINTPIRSVTPGKPLYAVTGIFDSAPFDLAPAGTPLWHTRFNNFAPRVGVAFQLTPQTVVRGGFGLYYDLGYGGGLSGTMIYFPYGAADSVSGPIPFNLTNPAFQPPAFTLTPGKGTPYIDAVDPHLKVPFTYEWNIAVQRGLGANQSVSATYVGAHGENLLREDTIISTVGNTLPLPPTTAIGPTTTHCNSSFSAAWRAAFRPSLPTPSVSPPTRPRRIPTGGIWTTSLSNVNVASDLGPSRFDVRNSFSAAVSWQIPSPHWNGLSDVLLRNWQIDSIVRISSAEPYGVTAEVDSPLFYETRPNVVPGVPFYLPAPGQPGGRTLNENAFTAPASGQQGDLPRNYFRGFPIDQTDLSLRRQFHLTERTSLFLGAEYFNLFNHPMFAANLYNHVLGYPGFGQITETLNEDLGLLNPLYQIGGPRSGQLTIKFLF